MPLQKKSTWVTKPYCLVWEIYANTDLYCRVGHRCHSCQTTETPEWRRGPDGARTLCNACGLRELFKASLFSSLPPPRFTLLTLIFSSMQDYSKLLRKGSVTVQSMNPRNTTGVGSSSRSERMFFEYPAPHIMRNDPRYPDRMAVALMPQPNPTDQPP